MNKRQVEIEKLTLDYEKQCLKDLQKVYTQALADVKFKLKMLKARDETQSVVYQVQFQKTLETQIQSALDIIKNGSIKSVNDFLNKIYEDNYLGTIYSLQGQGIPVVIGIDHDQLARVVNKPTESMQFSQRLYDNADRLGVAFKSQMSRGIANNSTYGKIAKQLALESEANYRQAMRIVRTEGGRVKSEAKLDSMKAAKKEGADIVKQWDATFDGKTRPEHRYLDGQIREIDEPFEDSQGRKAQAPCKFGIASMDINCRCIVVERARWALEGEEIPNKTHNVTGEIVEADDYKEWKGKYLAKQETKQEPKQEASKAKTPTKLTLDSLPLSFTDSKRTQTQTQKLVDYVNGLDGDSNAKEILANLGKLDSYRTNGIDFKIIYGTNSSLAKTMRYNGDAIDAALNIPKLDGEDISGAVNTTLHELGHLVDSYVGTKGKQFGAISETHEKLIEAITEGVGEPNAEIMALFKQVDDDLKDIKESLGDPLGDINKKYRDSEFASYSDYSKAFKKARKELIANSDYMQRNKLNGINNLQDIYDALSDGLWRDMGRVKYGHGTRYYNSFWKTKQASEIFANYFSLSITRPDLIEMLKRDKPRLCEALDEILEEILKGVQ